MCACPISRLAEAIGRVQEAVAEAGLFAPILGHVGDGNFHVFFVLPPDDQSAWGQGAGDREAMVEHALELGGTSTGEHGIGMGKRCGFGARAWAGGGGADAADQGGTRSRRPAQSGQDLRMNLRHIEIFHAVYVNGSVSAAARALNVFAAVRSKMLRHAESLLGFQLFQRTNGGLVPTQDAHVLFTEVSENPGPGLCAQGSGAEPPPRGRRRAAHLGAAVARARCAADRRVALPAQPRQCEVRSPDRSITTICCASSTT
jgi:hypothetical protein